MLLREDASTCLACSNAATSLVSRRFLSRSSVKVYGKEAHKSISLIPIVTSMNMLTGLQQSELQVPRASFRRR